MVLFHPSTSSVAAAEAICDALGGHRNADGSFHVKCPAHDDRTPSLHLTVQDERLLVKCFAGCTQESVIDSLAGRGLWVETPAPIAAPIARPQAMRPQATREPDAIYDFPDADGKIVAQKARWDGPTEKRFAWRKIGASGWPGGVKMADVGLYGMHRLAKYPDLPVYLVEGEKCVDALTERRLLAVSLGGGSSGRSFGRALECLRGRKVILWPDNDAPGQGHMQFVEAQLRSLGVTPSYVSLPINLPDDGGDAVDYFTLGGTVENIGAKEPGEPVVSVLKEDQVRVIIPTPGGVVTLDFGEMEKSPRSLDCRLIISYEGQSGRPLIQRQNLESNSQRVELRRELDSECGKDNVYGWSGVLRDAFWLASRAFLNQSRGVDISDIPDPTGELLLIPPLLAAEGCTVLFAMGGSFKSYIAQYLALCCSMKINAVPPFQCRPGKVLYVDYESGPGTLRMRGRRILAGFGIPIEPHGIRYWKPPKRVALKDCREALKSECASRGVSWCIIDSAVPACGGDPMKPEIVSGMLEALDDLGIPALILAHVPKLVDGEPEHPFGSVFWSNLPRRTWFVKMLDRPGAGLTEHRILLKCKKANDGDWPRSVGLKLRMEPHLGPVSITTWDPSEESKPIDNSSLNNRIKAALQRGGLTVEQLAEDLDANYKVVDSTLRRGATKGIFVKVPLPDGAHGKALWCLVGDQYLLPAAPDIDAAIPDVVE